MPAASKTSDTGGRRSEPSPTDRRKPSSMRMRGTPALSAASRSPVGARVAHTPIAPPRAAAVATARLTVRQNAGRPPAAARNSPIRRRFHRDMPTQTVISGLRGSDVSRPVIARPPRIYPLRFCELISTFGFDLVQQNRREVAYEAAYAGRAWLLNGSVPPGARLAVASAGLLCLTCSMQGRWISA